MSKRILVAALVMCAYAVSVRAEVEISLHDGKVSLSTHDATVRQILEAWAKVGQTKIVNLERLSSGPITLQLKDVPEPRALQILLRSVSGYLAAPRPTLVANASRYDRIIVMPTAAAARPPSPAPSAVPAPPPPAPPTPRATDDQADDQFRNFQPNQPPGMPPPPGQRGPVFSTFPNPDNQQPPQMGQPQQGVQAPPPVQGPTSKPVMPAGASAPGIIMAPPPQPGAPGQPPQLRQQP